MVSTGSLNKTTAAVPSRKATIAPGIRLETARQKIITSTVPAASAVAVYDKVWKLPASASMRCQNTPGTLASCKPKKSFTWVLAIRMAIPLVKPMTTGRGINFTAVPMPAMPMIISRMPAITVHMKSPSTP